MNKLKFLCKECMKLNNFTEKLLMQSSKNDVNIKYIYFFIF